MTYKAQVLQAEQRLVGCPEEGALQAHPLPSHNQTREKATARSKPITQQVFTLLARSSRLHLRPGNGLCKLRFQHSAFRTGWILHRSCKPSFSDHSTGLPLRLGRAALLQDPGRGRCSPGVRCAGMHGVGGAQTRLHHKCGRVQLVPELHLPVCHHHSAPVCGAGLRSDRRVPGLGGTEPEQRVSR